MAWLYLALAILLEVVGTTCMKLSDGFAHMVPSVLVFVFYAASFTMMIHVLKTLDLGITYAVWSGVGTALVAVIGVIWFHETMTPLKIASIAFIVIGVAGLNMASGQGS